MPIDIENPGVDEAALRAALRQYGMIAQIVYLNDGANASGTTLTPLDNTIPQNTEGNQFLSLEITPTNALSTLIIEVIIYLSHGTAGRWISAALFQDTNVNAIASALGYYELASEMHPLIIKHYMVAGTTSPTTFKVRCGSNSAGTVYFNSVAATLVHDGIISSSIAITEILP